MADNDFSGLLQAFGAQPLASPSTPGWPTPSLTAWQPSGILQNIAGNGSQDSSPPDVPIDPQSGQPMNMPPGVSLQRNAEIGQLLSLLPSWLSSPMLPSILPLKEMAMAGMFAPNMPMDYQRTYSQNGLINRDYINAGNYNFGLMAANAGYSLPVALMGAGIVNLFGHGDKSGPFFTNPGNNKEIVAGYSSAGSP
jgi:hypothetical protein